MKTLSLTAGLVTALLATTGLADDSAATEDNGRGELEYGIGLSNLYFPHYPGSDESHLATLPFPFLVYHSEDLELDGANIRGRLWEHGGASLDVSTGGALRVDADDNEAREDMPNLGWLGELGPALRYSPDWDWRSTRWQYRVSLPLRQAVELDGFSLSRRGWVTEPNVHVKRDFHGPDHHWEFQARIGVRYASEDYHQHFYGVEDRYATPERPAYSAESGLSAYTLSLGLGWRHGKWWVGGFARYYDFTDSVIRDSPLLRERRQAALGLSVAWVLGRTRL